MGEFALLTEGAITDPLKILVQPNALRQQM
jgi:hypothetical protein